MYLCKDKIKGMKILTPELQPKWNSIIIDVLKKLISICDDNNIVYYCCGGTAIGAVRHHGMIPWDDDIDVFMPRPDYDRFISACHKMDLGKYELCTLYDKENYFMYFSKLCNAGTTIMERIDTPCVYGLFVDIFPLDGTSDDFDEAVSLKRKFSKIQNRMEAISTRNTFHEYISLLADKHEWGRFVRKTIGFFFRNSYRRLLLKQMDNIAYKYDYEKAKNVVVYSGVYGDIEVYPKEWVSNPVQFSFEDISVNLSGGYDSYLRHFFGDYMQMPPVEKRIFHHEKVYFNINRRLSLEEVQREIRNEK